MIIAIVVTFLSIGIFISLHVVIFLVIGGAIGAFIALKFNDCNAEQWQDFSLVGLACFCSYSSLNPAAI